MSLDLRIRELAQELGADFYGVADLAPAHAAILAQGGPTIAAYPRSITVGIRLMDAVVDPIANHHDRAAVLNYRQHGYDVVNARLDEIVSRLASTLQRQGHRALPLPARAQMDTERLLGHFSHKMGANLAGLGWIGKSCLMITPQAGPRVRWCTVLTEAPLEPTGQIGEQRCGDCTACVDICPAHAFTGVPFRPEDPRAVRYDAHACSRYLASREETIGHRTCGLCLYVCPYGRQKG
jgi:epoxyqueuosine reductase QueG